MTKQGRGWAKWVGYVSTSLFACATSSCGVSSPGRASDDTGVVEQPIIGGTVDADTDDPSVVAVKKFVRTDDGDVIDYTCTGSIVSSTRVLTAAHCLDARGEPGSVSYLIKTRADVNITDSSLRVWRTTFDTGYDPNNIYSGQDVGIVELTSMTALTSFPIDILGAGSVRLVGYGDDTHDGTGDGIRRQVTTTIVAKTDATVTVGNSNAQGCHGDSGGPVIQRRYGHDVIVGVVTGGRDITPNDLCYYGTTATRLDSVASFIARNVPSAAQTADILWRHMPSGQPFLWLGGVPSGGLSMDPAGTDYQIVGVGDFNGNGKSDILWRRNTGEIVIWPDATSPGYSIGALDGNWFVAGIADFDGDRSSDILWRSVNGDNVIWYGGVAPGLWIAASDTSWKVAGVGDFGGNGLSDILWRNVVNGDIVIWPDAWSPGAKIGALDGNWDVAGVGDFDGDFKSDILWHSVNGDNVIWYGGVAPGLWITKQSTDWKVAGVADFDGNRLADILWRNADGRIEIWLDGNSARRSSIGRLDNNWQIQGTGTFDN